MTDRRKYLLVMGVILLAVTGSLLFAVPGSPLYKKPVLGLDLQGGLEVVLRAQPGKNHKLTPDDLTKSISIMQSRINGLGDEDVTVRIAPQLDVRVARRAIGSVTPKASETAELEAPEEPERTEATPGT